MANATIFRDAKPTIVLDGIAKFSKLDRNNGSQSLKFNDLDELEAFRQLVAGAVVAGEGKKGQAAPKAAKTPPCPKCGAPTAEKQGKYGTFYGCTKFPNCRGIVQDGKKPSGRPKSFQK